MKKIALLSHCVLNSYCEAPPASDAYRKGLVGLLLEEEVSIVQLPCPELCFQALERESILPGDAQAEAYRDYCRTLLSPVVKNLEEYKKHHIQIAYIVGIDTSPSCSVKDKKAIMMEILLEEMEKLDIQAEKLADMPVRGDGTQFFEELNK